MRATSKRLNFEIDKDDKAVIYIKAESGDDISCMIDTGANVPVWFMGEEFLQLRFPSAYKSEKVTIIHGLGKEPLMDVPVWNVPHFNIEDDLGNVITFHNMLIPVIKAKKYSFNMILPLTILNRTKFSFDYRKSVISAFFTIETNKDNYYIRPICMAENDKYINRIQAFYQDDIDEAS